MQVYGRHEFADLLLFKLKTIDNLFLLGLYL